MLKEKTEIGIFHGEAKQHLGDKISFKLWKNVKASL